MRPQSTSYKFASSVPIVGLMVLACIFCGAVGAQAPRSSESNTLSRSPAEKGGQSAVEISRVVKRGLSGRIEFEHPSPSLVAKSDQSLSGPVLVRLERTGEVTEGSVQLYRYELRFFGLQAGIFDLAERIKLDGGSEENNADLLESVWVEIISDLPSDRGTDLYEIADPEIGVWSGYRTTAMMVGLIWCSVPIWFLLSRYRGRPIQTSEPIAVPATVLQRLSALGELATARRLEPDEKAEFEWLVYTALGDHHQLPTSLIRSVPALRRNKSASKPIAELERWLHSGKTEDLECDGKKLLEIIRPILMNDSRTMAEPHESHAGGSP